MKKILIVVFILVAVGLFGRGFWKGYTEHVYGEEMFVIKLSQTVEGDSLETWLFGKVALRVGWERSSKHIELGMLEKCKECVSIERKKLLVLPKEYEGVFENKPGKEVYLSTDTPSLEIADTRYFIVSDIFELDYKKCLIQAENNERALKKYNAKSICVNKI